MKVVVSRFRGSSPLTRGALPSQPKTCERCRLIPAHAGSTQKYRTAADPRGAHPRSRGEHPPRTAGEVAAHNKEGQLVAQDDVTPLTRGGEPIA